MAGPDLITTFDGHYPQIHSSVFVDIPARIMGRVSIEADAAIWPGAVLRADDEDKIIGQGSAVLDLALIEAGALISRQACVHDAVIKSGALAERDKVKSQRAELAVKAAVYMSQGDG